MNSKFHISLGVILIVVLNAILILLSCILSNEYLVMNSWILYGIQFFLMIPFLLWKIEYIKNLFLPSFFVLVYYSINLFLGSYVSPRGFGFVTWFLNDLLISKNYNIIVSYFLLTNLSLFLICCNSLFKLNSTYLENYFQKQQTQKIKPVFLIDLIGPIIAFSIYFLLSQVKVYSLFSFQLAVIIIYGSYVAYERKWFRYIVYFVFLSGMVAFNFENKREVVIVLFFLFFVEAYYSKWTLKISFKRIIIYIVAILVFISLVLTSSILRGYGNFKPKSVTDAVSDIPKYIKSSEFIDGFTENLELNYNYSTAVTSMDMILKGEIKYQYGLTLIKVFFLPVPRTIFTFKPMSSMQIYTKAYKPEYWKNGGSLPIAFPCDMFMNFNFFGLIPFVLIWFIIDSFFIKFHLMKKRNIGYFAYPALFITVLVFARGSGIEQYILYFLFSLVGIILFVEFRNKLFLMVTRKQNM